MHWPNDFPENCPPNDAQARSIIVYMLISTPIDVEKDFLPLYDRQPKGQANLREDAWRWCQAKGLSVFENKEHLRSIQGNVRRFKNHQIGRFRITPAMGVLKPTSSLYGDSHRTWWFPVGIKPWQGFEGIET